MLKFKSLLNLVPVTALLVVSNVYGQNNNANNKLAAPAAHITIDGNLKDWGDSLRYYNEEKKLYYTLANDKQYLYLAIRFNDRTEQERILMAGLTWGVNTKGKKKETYSLTFPAVDPDSKPAMFERRPEGAEPATEKTAELDKEEMRKARLTRLRNMKVTGFKDVDYDIITTTNSYGFKAALDYDADGNMVYEAAIPLKFFDADDVAKGEWAFNFKINGITRPSGGNGGERGALGGGMGGNRGGGMGRGGMGGGGGMAGGGRGGRGGGMGRGGMRGGTETDRSALTKSEDFWEKFYLSKL